MNEAPTEHYQFDINTMPIGIEQQQVNALERIEALLTKLVELSQPQSVKLQAQASQPLDIVAAAKAHASAPPKKGFGRK